jgi:Domain of unknown function (DUF5710)
MRIYLDTPFTEKDEAKALGTSRARDRWQQRLPGAALG